MTVKKASTPQDVPLLGLTVLDSKNNQVYSIDLYKDESVTLHVAYDPANTTHRGVKWTADHSSFVKFTATGGGMKLTNTYNGTFSSGATTVYVRSTDKYSTVGTSFQVNVYKKKRNK